MEQVNLCLLDTIWNQFEDYYRDIIHQVEIEMEIEK